MFMDGFVVNMETIANILPNTHCSDRTLLPSGILPLYFPMQMPAWRTALQTVPPQSWISSTRFWVGGWECGDTNIGGWFWNRSCWCSPADKCLWRRQIWGEKHESYILFCRLQHFSLPSIKHKTPMFACFVFLKNTFGINGMQSLCESIQSQHLTRLWNF